MTGENLAEQVSVGGNGQYLRQTLLPGAACGVFHALSSLSPPSLSVRLSPCRSCLLRFSNLRDN